MNRLTRMLDRFLTHLINFLIDVREWATKPEYVTVGDWICEKWGKTQTCPWCDGLGILTEKGESLQD